MVIDVLKEGARIDEIRMSKAALVVGRDATCDHVLEHPSISRKHAALVLDDSRTLHALDLGSTYGTTLSGIKLGDDATPVEPGADLRFGLSSRTFVLREEKELEGRAKRQAEIAALTREMEASKPTWTPHVAPVAPVPEEEEVPRPELAVAKRWELPISSRADMERATKTVSAIAVDPAGGRVLVGSLDTRVRIYDFGGMDSEHKSFKTFEADEGHSIVALSFSPTGDRFLCCSGSAQPSIFTRDGAFLLKFNRGDMYVTDVTKTTGHTTMVTGGHWQPNEGMRCGTCSMDGSVRLWDLCGKTGLRDVLFCEQVVRVRDKKARKTAATAFCFRPDGRVVVAGCADGSLQMWGIKGRAHSYVRPDSRADAHSGDVSCVKFSPDGHTIASRADDGFVKLWDARKLQQPLAAFDGVPQHQLNDTLDWSPDGAMVVAGDHEGRVRFFSAGGPAHDVFKQAGGYAPLCGLRVHDAAPQVLWHPRIRQIFCGTSKGDITIFYDPDLSAKGALLSTHRHRSTKRSNEALVRADDPVIVNPNALPMYRNDDALRKRSRYAKNRNDPKASKKPDPPLEQGQQGRNTGARSTYTSFYLEQNLPENIRNSDPREALLKYADKPAIFRTDATFYKDAEGKQVFADRTLEQEQADFVKRQKSALDSAVFGTKS